MKAMIWNGVAVAVLIAAAVAYDRLVLAPRAEAMRQEVRQTVSKLEHQIELKDEVIDKLKQETSRATDQLRDAVQETETAYENQADRQARQRLLSSALAQLSQLKVMIAEAYFSTGSMPTDLAREAGISDLSAFKSKGVKDLQYLGGTLQLSFDESIGSGASLSLIPEVAKNGMIAWRCQAKALRKDLLRPYPECLAED
jgi:hypothetical protein